MPGVHADIGGNSDAVFLGDVALLTMIERTRTYCPELIWDEGYIDARKKQLGNRVQVTISNERFDWKQKLLLKADRQIAMGLNQGSSGFVGEELHPIYDYLDGKKFWIRSKWQSYAPSNVPREMKKFSSCDDELFRIGSERALAYTVDSFSRLD
jgi:hypothetical protein